jgi:hypothetical protein
MMKRIRTPFFTSSEVQRVITSTGGRDCQSLSQVEAISGQPAAVQMIKAVAGLFFFATYE